MRRPVELPACWIVCLVAVAVALGSLLIAV